jgi:hypothetical protein
VGVQILTVLAPDEDLPGYKLVISFFCRILSRIFRVRAQSNLRQKAVARARNFCDDLKPPCELTYGEKADSDFPDQRPAAWRALIIIFACQSERFPFLAPLSTAPDIV